MCVKSVATAIKGIIIDTPTVSIKEIKIENTKRQPKNNLSRFVNKRLILLKNAII